MRITFGYRRHPASAAYAGIEEIVAKALGWDLAVVQGREAANSRGSSGAFELIEPAALDLQAPKLPVLRLSNWQRFGNAVRQLRNVFTVAERWGTKRIEFPGPHEFSRARRLDRSYWSGSTHRSFHRGLPMRCRDAPDCVAIFSAFRALD